MTADLTGGTPRHRLDPPRFRDTSGLDAIDLLDLPKVGLPPWPEGEQNELNHDVVEAWLDGGRWVKVGEEGLSRFAVQKPRCCRVAVELE